MTAAQQAQAIRAMEQMSGGDILNVSQVAGLFGCSPKTVRKWVKEDNIPHFRLPGGHIRFRRRVLQDWIDQGCGAE